MQANIDMTADVKHLVAMKPHSCLCVFWLAVLLQTAAGQWGPSVVDTDTGKVGKTNTELYKKKKANMTWHNFVSADSRENHRLSEGKYVDPASPTQRGLLLSCISHNPLQVFSSVPYARKPERWKDPE